MMRDRSEIDRHIDRWTYIYIYIYIYRERERERERERKRERERERETSLHRIMSNGRRLWCLKAGKYTLKNVIIAHNTIYYGPL